MNDRIKLAEQEVHACLNYGGVFHDEGPTTKELELAYDQGELADELSHMRRLAAALNELAAALEADQKGDEAGGQSEIQSTYKGPPEPLDPALEKIRALRDELRAMGFACGYTIRAPGSARAPVVYLFTGMTESDVEQAREDRRPGLIN